MARLGLDTGRGFGYEGLAMDTAPRQMEASPTPDTERRRTQRLTLQLPAAVFLRGATRYVPFRLHDISMTGAYLSSDVQVGPGERFVLSIRPPGATTPIVAQARVVRLDADDGAPNDAGMGVVFTAMSHQSRAELAGLWRETLRSGLW